jgi:two-component system chemotaxis response regulator CheB
MFSNANKPSIRVLIVDDSAFMRLTISRYLDTVPGIKVVGSARDGQEALELIPDLNPDVITLDVEMPRLDGISTLRAIMRENPRPVIMLSSLTTEGAVETIQALTLGAVDFVGKPSNKANINSVMQDVAQKIQRASTARVQPYVTPRITQPVVKKTADSVNLCRPLFNHERVVVIGSSTGGPRALNIVVPELPANLSAAVLIVQHMPAGFTRSLAERLDGLSPFRVKEAEPGDKLEVGKILIAPGGFHTVLDENGAVTLNQNPTVHGVRPAIDVTLTSVVKRYGSAVIGVILTGMGSDGSNGCALVHNAGGWVIAEDESTCIVWGMPRSVVEIGVVNEVASLQNISHAISQAVVTDSHTRNLGK